MVHNKKNANTCKQNFYSQCKAFGIQPRQDSAEAGALGIWSTGPRGAGRDDLRKQGMGRLSVGRGKKGTGEPAGAMWGSKT